MAEGQIYVLGEPLSGFVAFLWHQEARRPSWRRERLLPTGTVELVVRLSDPCLGPVVCGPHSLPFELQNAGRSSVIAAHFRPGGYFPFAAIPPAALHSLVVPLEELWGSAANELQERLGGERGLREVSNRGSIEPHIRLCPVNPSPPEERGDRIHGHALAPSS